MILPSRLRAVQAERRLRVASAEIVVLQAENHRLHGIIRYQHHRMREMSTEALAAQVRATTPRRPFTVPVVMGRVGS